jgi:hypothetical protein
MNDNKTEAALVAAKKKLKKKTVQPIITPKFNKNLSGTFVDHQRKLEEFFSPRQPQTENGGGGGGE